MAGYKHVYHLRSLPAPSLHSLEWAPLAWIGPPGTPALPMSTGRLPLARSAASRRESVRCIPHAPRSPDRSMPEDRRLATRNTMRTRRDVCNAALCWRAALTVVKSCRMAHTVSYPIRSSGRLHPAQHVNVGRQGRKPWIPLIIIGPRPFKWVPPKCLINP